MDCSQGSRVSRHGVVLLSHLLRFHSCVTLLCPSNIDGFSWVTDEPVRDMFGRAVFVTESDVFLGDMGVHSRADGSRVRFSQVADEESVSWRERRFHAYEVFSRTERNSDARGHR